LILVTAIGGRAQPEL